MLLLFSVRDFLAVDVKFFLVLVGVHPVAMVADVSRDFPMDSHVIVLLGRLAARVNMSLLTRVGHVRVPMAGRV